MSKNDGWAEVTLLEFIDKPLDIICGRAKDIPPSFQVIVNHFDGEPEIWDTFETEQDAKEEAVLWNKGLWGKGFTNSAEWLKKQAEESKGNNELERA
jgi:hypothetical protein